MLKVINELQIMYITDVLLLDCGCSTDFVNDFIKNPSKYFIKHNRDQTITFSIESMRSPTYKFNAYRFATIKDACKNCINIDICNKGLIV